MHILEFTINEQILTWTNPCRVPVEKTRGWLKARFVTDSEWHGMNLRAIFHHSTMPPVEVPVTSDLVDIPPECILRGYLYVGLVGLNDGGAVQITTKRMARPVVLDPATTTAGVPPESVLPEAWEKALGSIGNLSDLDTTAKNNLVAAINEVLRTGGGSGGGTAGNDGREVELSVVNGFIVWRYVGESDWKNLIAVADLKGDPGRGVKSIAGNSNGSWTITYTDNTTETVSSEAYAALKATIDKAVLTESMSLTASQQAQVRTNIAAAAAADLASFYKKSETYSKDEINVKISAIPKFSIAPVTALPTSQISATTVYLVKTTSADNLYMEYIFVPTSSAATGPFTDSQGRWEPLGAQTVDLTGYATEAWANLTFQPIGNYVTAQEFEELSETVGLLSAEKLSVTPQELTEEEQAVARKNIGAAKAKTLDLELSGNHLMFDANGPKDCSIEIVSESETVDFWHLGRNLLPKLPSNTVAGLTITVEDDGTIDIDGTLSYGTGANASVVVAQAAMDLPFTKEAENPYYMTLWYDEIAPNANGYIMFRVHNTNNNLIFSNSLRPGNTGNAPGKIDVIYTSSFGAGTLATYSLYLYNVPNGTVFNHYRIKAQVERTTTPGTVYEPPSYAKSTLAVENGVVTLNEQAFVGKNYFVTTGDSMTVQVESAEAPTQSFLGKRWACFGDSITYKAADSTAKRYFDYVAADLGLFVVNYGRATTGYANTGNVSNGEYYKRMANIIPDTFDVLTIMGSTNDVGPMARGEIQLGTYTDTGTETVCGCINTTIDKFYELAPLKRLGIMTMLPTYAYGPNLIDTTVAENYVNALIQICKNRGIPCLDLYHGSGLRSWDAATRAAFFSDGDGIHPNDEGAKFIAPTIREFVKTLI